MQVPPYEIHAFSISALYEILNPGKFVVEDVARHRPARYLCAYLQELQVRTIIVEHDYTDGDYLDDFAAYYVKCFNSYQRRCKRLHFFSIEISEEKFLTVIEEGSDKQEFQDAYLGFIVARPLPDAIIGRTILEVNPNGVDLENVRCVKSYKVNLFGLSLTVKRSLAFQEQDTVLAACATVALWSSFHKTSDLFRTNLPTPAAITRMANQIASDTRPFPSRELDIQQICHAIRKTGLEAEVVRIEKGTPLLSIIYAYLAMGLPIILIVNAQNKGNHAITLVGHSLREEPVIDREVAKGEESISMIGLRIDKLYAHDDQTGPFSPLSVVYNRNMKGRTHPIELKPLWKDDQCKETFSFYPQEAIIPVYHKIRIRFMDFYQWLIRLNELIRQATKKTAGTEWDVKLWMTNDYKTQLRTNTIDQTELRRIMLKQFPRFIWSATLRQNDSKIVEVIADATDVARSFPISDIIWHKKESKSLVKQELDAADGQKRTLLLELLTRPFWDFLKRSMP